MPRTGPRLEVIRRQAALPSDLERSADPFTGRVTGSVTRQDIPFLVEETAISEFYAR